MSGAPVSTKPLDSAAKGAKKLPDKILASRDAPDRWVACNHGEPETDLFGCLAPMFVEQMSVDLANKDPAVLVTEPRSNRHEIDSRHHANRTKIMA